MRKGRLSSHLSPRAVVYSVAVLGVLSAVAFRAIIVFQRLRPDWVRLTWYIGTAGYLIFFFYRYLISQKRKKMVHERRLVEKVGQSDCFSNQDKESLLYLLASLERSPENINYAAIFILSFLAIAFDVAASLLGLA